MTFENNSLIANTASDAIRWSVGERLNHLFEQRCDLLQESGQSQHLAVAGPGIKLTYRELDEKANQLAGYLLRQGIQPGDRIGLFLDRSFYAYVAMLAVLKVNAAYVPLDASFPGDRIEFIAADADVRFIITLSALESRLEGIDVVSISLDNESTAISRESTKRFNKTEIEDKDQLAYIIYTSGSTGKPKGVAVEHPSICNFLKVAGEVYGLCESDRVYQGMTVAFDFSIEEIWIPLITGATLFPGNPETSLVGSELTEFLRENHITALCCVPTLLATLDSDLPKLRFILLSGEACPENLLLGWHRPDRRILNAYGPTEATVTATWTELYPGKPVTIGRPLPTYSIVILDEQDAIVPNGAIGEIGIAGIGLARDYVNMEDLTKKCFIPDFLGIANNPSRRIYRTGDLGCINDDGEIEFHGRIDGQVKIRGYRIELTEIESVLLQLPEIAQAVVTTHSVESGPKELVAHYILRDDSPDVSPNDLLDALQDRLPAYMIPAFLQPIAEIPILPSGKADRKSLPAPQGPRGGGRRKKFVAPKSELEIVIAGVLEKVLKIDGISAVDHFFDELGGHSLLMACFCTELRKRCRDMEVSMRDIYQHPTVEKLAAHLSAKPRLEKNSNEEKPFRIPSNAEYYGCGALQFLSYAVFAAYSTLILVKGMGWIYGATELFDIYLRTVGFIAGTFLLYSVTPIAMKWLLVGKARKETIPIWSMRYFRFWLVKSLVRSSPMVVFKGSPLFNIYLRLLGANIGKDVVIQSHLLSPYPDLLSIGDGTLLGKDSIVLGYKAQGNYIHTGPVTIGANVFVGEGSVLDIDTVMEDNTQLGHSSSLQSGQVVPGGAHYHGSPAQETEINYCSVEPRKCFWLRKAIYSTLQLSLILLVSPALIVAIIRAAITIGKRLPMFSAQIAPAWNWSQVPWLELIVGSALLFMCLLTLHALSVVLIPRVLSTFIEPGKTYGRYGIHHFLSGTVSLISNSRYLNRMLGDSSFITSFLQAVGYDLGKVVQTGANFGLTQKHDNPFLCKFGINTMISDGFSSMNIQESSTSFRLNPTIIGNRNFVGNNVRFPSGSKTGDNCLLATKVMVPIDGPIRENVGLLGSPSFEIPRTVERDRALDPFADEATLLDGLRKKNLHNLTSIISLGFLQWFHLFALVSGTYTAIVFHKSIGTYDWIWAGYAVSLFSLLYSICIERCGLALARLEPRIVTIYDRKFWRVERYWKSSDPVLGLLFKGTPFKNIMSRALGIRVGRKVFDDGTYVSEKQLVEIGDYCNLNESSVLQGHSLEDGLFKCDSITLGKGCSIGINSFVHYGVRIGDRAVLDPDSFLMKGEEIDTETTWQGNPAHSL